MIENKKAPRSLICQSWDLATFTLDMPTLNQTGSQQENLLVLLRTIQDKIQAKQNKNINAKIDIGQLRLVQASKEIRSIQHLNYDYTLRVELRGPLPGGKGGYGSLLRSMKPKAKADENYEACRDLSGRRLRHVNNQERLREWRQRQEEEAKYVEEETKEYEKNKQQLKHAIHQNNFKLDDKYKQQIQEGSNSVTESVKEASQAILQAKRDKKAQSKSKLPPIDFKELLKSDKSSDLDALFGGYKAKKRLKRSEESKLKQSPDQNDPLKNPKDEDMKDNPNENKSGENVSVGMIKVVHGADDQ